MKFRSKQFWVAVLVLCAVVCLIAALALLLPRGGQPVQPASVRNFVDLKSLRAKALYDADEAKPLRKSHENPELLKIYEEYFGEFGSHLAHRILHTTYVERPHF